MAFTFDSTVKGTTANSYVSVADADDYFSGNIFNNFWIQLSASEKEQYLVFATNRLETEQFSGLPTTDTQALSMPRKDVLDSDGINYLDEDTIPSRFENAALELVMQYIQEYKEESPTFSKQDQSRMSSIKLGPISAQLRDNKEHSLSDLVKRHLRSVGLNFWSGSSPFIPVVRV